MEANCDLKVRVISFLRMIGYNVEKANEDDEMVEDELDILMIDFILEKTQTVVKSRTNLLEIPEKLTHVIVEMSAGEFLRNKRTSGKLDGFEINLDAPVLQSDKQGDTALSWATDKVMSAEERLNQLINHLINSGNGEIAGCRRLSW